MTKNAGQERVHDEPEQPESWVQRHGAFLLAGGLGLIIVLVVVMDWFVRSNH
jgi:hypothetical protein